MRKRLKFTKSPIIRVGEANAMLVAPDEGIIFDIDTFYDLSEATITLQNGKLKKTVKLTAPFRVPDEFVFSGRLYIAVDLYSDGEKIKHWDCLPLKIVESNDGEVKAFDEFTNLEKRVEELEKKNKIIL